jgi:hypothetical protein
LISSGPTQNMHKADQQFAYTELPIPTELRLKYQRASNSISKS